MLGGEHGDVEVATHRQQLERIIEDQHIRPLGLCGSAAGQPVPVRNHDRSRHEPLVYQLFVASVAP